MPAAGTPTALCAVAVNASSSKVSVPEQLPSVVHDPLNDQPSSDNDTGGKSSPAVKYASCCRPASSTRARLVHNIFKNTFVFLPLIKLQW
ncbi:hypothetical protein DIPPA_30291 [Diplonema papillatum]|nr:hypothetical protein DIPPA_30291 [Diplonema papillatum]